MAENNGAPIMDNVEASKIPALATAENNGAPITANFEGSKIHGLAIENNGAPISNNVEGSKIFVLVKVCVLFAVAATVLYFQIHHRPKETDVYHTNDPNETTRGGAAYTCGCSLPTSLQDKTDVDTKNVSLNICYESSSLETVTVLMYSNSAATLVPELEPEIKQLASYNVTNRTVEGWEGGYRVNQEAHDLSGYIVQDPLDPPIQNLFLNGRREPERYPTVEYLRSREFLTFPRSYLRLTLTFRCNNCSNCSLDTVNNIAKNVTHGSNKDSAWATCFYWGADNECDSGNKYEARCLLYPTEALPPNFAIHAFLDAFMTQLLGVSIEVTLQGGSPFARYDDYNWTTLQPSSLYLNVSQVENSANPIQYGFVEVVKSSALWASLLNLFPSLGDCSAMDNVTVCNGTSVCNVFTNANAYDLSCHDMKDTAQCKDLMGTGTSATDPRGFSTFDNAENLRPDYSVPWVELECPQFKCFEAPPYTLIWSTSESMQNDSLNRFLSSRKLNHDWGQRSGVCTNTYENVLRFSPPTVKLDDSHPMFLQSNCTNSRCWLTGYYRYVNDTPREEWKKMPEELFPTPSRDIDRLFVCYRIEREAFVSWFITTMGVLFGWLGTVELLFRWFGTPIVRKFHKFMQDRQRAKNRTPSTMLKENCAPQGSYGRLFKM